MVGVVVVSSLPWLLLGALAVQLEGALGLTIGGLGVAIASRAAASASLSRVLGRLAQRIGPARSLCWSALLAAGAMVGTAFAARNTVQLSGWLALAGAGTAMSQSASDLWIGTNVTRRQGLTVAVKQAAVPFAAVLAGVAVPALALTVDWRAPLLVGAGLAAVLAVLARRLVDDPHVPDARHHGDLPGGLLALLGASSGLGAASVAALGGFFVTSATTSGMRESDAALLFALGAGLGITMRVVMGAHADRRQSGLLLRAAIMLAIGSIGFVGLAVGEPLAFMVAGPLAFGVGWGWPGLFILAVIRTNPTAPGAASGAVQTGSYAGALLGPLLFGLVAERSLALAWILMAITALAASAVMLTARSAIKRQVHRRETLAQQGPGR